MTVLNYLGRAVKIGRAQQDTAPNWIAKASDGWCFLEWIGDPAEVHFGCNQKPFPLACSGVAFVVSAECKHVLVGRKDVFTVGDCLIPENRNTLISEVAQ